VAAAGLFDKLQLALVVSALAIDVLVLLAITGRITDEYGTTPNRAAALGENVILLVNLAYARSTDWAKSKTRSGSYFLITWRRRGRLAP
jgi:hypothetical protein